MLILDIAVLLLTSVKSHSTLHCRYMVRVFVWYISITFILFHNELKYIFAVNFRGYWHILKPSPHWSDIFVEKPGLTFSWKKQWPIKGYADGFRICLVQALNVRVCRLTETTLLNRVAPWKYVCDFEYGISNFTGIFRFLVKSPQMNAFFFHLANVIHITN